MTRCRFAILSPTRPGTSAPTAAGSSPRRWSPRSTSSTAAFTAAQADPEFTRRAGPAAARLHRPAVAADRRARFAAARRRRPDPAQARGPQPHRLAQDQQRAGPGAADQAHGQEPGHRRDRRRPARRRHRDRGRAARPRVHRLHGRGGHPPAGAERGPDALLGAEVVPVTTGSRTLKDAINEAFRDWVDQRRDHPLPVRHGRRAAPVPADGARVPAGHRRRGPRAGARARSAGCPTRSRPASAAAPTRSASSPRSSPTRAVRLVGLEAGGDGVETGRHAATITGGTPGVLHGARSYLLQDDNGQTIESHSISAGLDYPGVGPGARVPARHRPGRVPPDHRRRGDGRRSRCCADRGHHPGHRVARTRWPARWCSAANSGPDAVILVNLSGRGDKDVETASSYFGLETSHEQRC